MVIPLSLKISISPSALFNRFTSPAEHFVNSKMSSFSSSSSLSSLSSPSFPSSFSFIPLLPPVSCPLPPFVFSSFSLFPTELLLFPSIFPSSFPYFPLLPFLFIPFSSLSSKFLSSALMLTLVNELAPSPVTIAIVHIKIPQKNLYALLFLLIFISVHHRFSCINHLI